MVSLKKAAQTSLALRDQIYPAQRPYKTHFFQVSALHRIYVEECGNPSGVPVMFLHGGPGGGLIPLYRRFFDPAFYRIILFDQRGCGKSTPHAILEENTTWDLVGDIETIRKNLNIKKFLIFGGSWGSTLALSYATQFPQNLYGMVLRGIFLCRPSELSWFYEEGANQIFPDLWEEYYLKPLSKKERNSPAKMMAYYKLLTGRNQAKALEAARCWSTWEGATSKLLLDKNQLAQYSDPHFALAFARVECHYFTHGAFFKTPNFLLDSAKKYRHLPGHIIQGRYDVVCPARSAWDLHQVWPKAKFTVLPQSGHSCKEKEILKELVKATEEFKALI